MNNLANLPCPGDCRGECFFGRCFCNAGQAGPDCKETVSLPPCFREDSLQVASQADACFMTPYGIPKVSMERWRHAQTAEQGLWQHTHETNDRSQSHFEMLGQYSAVPDDLGDVVEIGCGPFTQLAYLLEHRQPRPRVRSITLSDPGAFFYIANVTQCAFRYGTLGGHPVAVVNTAAEQFARFYEGRFDTVVMINVIEHVYDVFEVMRAVYALLKPGGTFIFRERLMPLHAAYERFHPIRLTREWYDHWATVGFDTVLRDYRPAPGAAEACCSGFNFIGRKKSA
jgi:SAM-dependent methyltransferase